MKVDKSRIRTVDEEYEHLKNQLELVTNFFPWDADKNKMRVSDISEARIRKKIKNLLDSEEGREYSLY